MCWVWSALVDGAQSGFTYVQISLMIYIDIYIHIYVDICLRFCPV